MGNFLCGNYVVLNSAGEKGSSAASVPHGDSQLSTIELSKKIQKLMLQMHGDHLSADGKIVDYEAIRNSSTFEEYVRTAKLLKDCDLKALEEQERKAFFLNVYNALNIHGIITKNGLPENLTGKLGYWKWTAYEIGGHIFSLDDIEHGILRGNAVSTAGCGKTHFAQNDPRLAFVLPKDARIHFALNCGARSCPAIRVYDAQNLERGLAAATTTFCSSEVKMIEKKSTIEFQLSHLFKWYRKDFEPGDGGQGDPVLHWIAENSTSSGLLKQIHEAFESDKKIEITYLPYDWSSNKPVETESSQTH